MKLASAMRLHLRLWGGLMETFSISDAAFTGFRIARERPRAVAVWAGIQLIASLALGGTMVVMAGPAFRRLTDLRAVAAMDPSQLTALFQELAPTYAVVLVYLLVFNSVLYGVMNRTVFRPADDRFGYFRLGVDELRQFALLLLTFLVVMVVDIAAAVTAGLAAVIVALMFRPAAGLIVALTVLAGVCAVVFVLVRLSLASAQTFATGRVNLFGSWALTRGRFWSILGTYVLALALGCVVLLLGLVVSLTLGAILGRVGAVTGSTLPAPASLAALVSPARLVGAVVGAVMTALTWPVFLTPPAAIYLRLTAGGASSTGAPT
jgi:hypothetical protein